MTLSRSVAIVSFALLAALGACQDGYDHASDASASGTQDSAATALELRGSLQGEVAPGKQSYSYRGLYAGMTRAKIESRVREGGGRPTAPCAPTAAKAPELSCGYETVLGPDSAHVTVTATFPVERDSAAAVAREITVVRRLPIDVDGVRVAKGLSDAFADQTSLLDRREATYGHHSALIHMGTMHGDRQNFATVTVASKQGREELTVTLTRSGPAVTPRAPAPTPGATRPAPPPATAPRRRG